jgi:hypothetical protein
MPGSAVFLYVHIGKPLRDTIIPVRRFVSGGGGNRRLSSLSRHPFAAAFSNSATILTDAVVFTEQ